MAVAVVRNSPLARTVEGTGNACPEFGRLKMVQQHANWQEQKTSGQVKELVFQVSVIVGIGWGSDLARDLLSFIGSNQAEEFASRPPMERAGANPIIISNIASPSNQPWIPSFHLS